MPNELCEGEMTGSEGARRIIKKWYFLYYGETNGKSVPQLSETAGPSELNNLYCWRLQIACGPIECSQRSQKFESSSVAKSTSEPPKTNRAGTQHPISGLLGGSGRSCLRQRQPLLSLNPHRTFIAIPLLENTTPKSE